uniref:Uncharacterized protein n=1 Tax=Acrobeloides nanus TaxID=290746 RepID=A0A914CBZ8_9BILA
MFLLGVIDMIVLPFNSIYSVYTLSLELSRLVSFSIGAIPTCGWYGASMTCILLAFNRLFEMLAPGIAKSDTPIVYLILNQPLRKAVFKLIRDLAGKPAGNPANLVGNASMFTVAITRSMYQDITTNQGSVNLNPINSQDITAKQDSVSLNPINSQDTTTNQGSVDRNPNNSQDTTTNQDSVDRNPINSQDLRLEDEQHHN